MKGREKKAGKNLQEKDLAGEKESISETLQIKHLKGQTSCLLSALLLYILGNRALYIFL